MAPRQLTYGYCSPVKNHIAGIGPATNRRRAMRAGTDLGDRRRRNAPALADESASNRAARRGGGNKKPASRRGAGRCPGIVRSLSPGRCCPRPPSGISGRRASLCCTLSGFFDSLSSAGHVCWAKPNHGFFQCQHFAAIIFDAARGRRPRWSPAQTLCGLRAHGRERRRRRFALHESAFFPAFSS